MSATDALLLIGGTALALLALIRFRAALAIYRGASQRRRRNVSDEHRAPSPSVAPLVAALVMLGFRRLGEVELAMPATGALGALRSQSVRHTAWVLADGPETTLAEVVDVLPMFSLETWLADDTIIQTTYPLGEDIDMPGLRATHVDTSPADAYHHHRQMVDARATATATPVEAHSVGDYLRRDATYREQFATIFLRRGFVRGPVLSAVVMVLFAGGLVWLALQ
jgi:hypothetical protein